MVSTQLSKALLALLLTASGNPLPGQQRDSTAGPRIEARFYVPTDHHLVAVNADTVSTGRTSVLEGAVLGFTVGAVLGGAIVKLSGRSPAPTGGDVIFSGMIYGMMGAVAGALIAAAIPAREPEPR